MSIPQSRPIPRPGVSDLLRRLPAALLVAAGTCATLGVSASAQQLDANWLNPASGVWSDGSRWSTGPTAPNNGTPPGTTYRALFGATGSNYTVTLNSAVGVDEVAINSANATLSIVANGSLTLTGALTRTAGSLTLNGGSILGGTLDLNGGAVAVTSNTANLISGTTVNGGLTLSGFAFAPTVGLRLNNSTINGNVQVPFRTGTLRIENGLTLNGAATIGGNSSISFATTQTQTTGDFVLSTGSFNVATGQTLTLGGTARIRGRGTIDGGTLVNGGVIQADEVGTSLQIRSSSFTNTGTLRALANSTLDIYSGLTTAWTNQGSIELQGGTVNFGGTISTAAGFGTVSGSGTLNFVGTINNAGSVLPIVAGPTQRLLNGSINGGTVQVAPGAELRLGGAGVVSTVATLNGVTMNGDSRALLVFAVRNGLNLNGTLRMNAGSTMWSHGNQSIVGGTILADAAGSSSTIRIGDTEAPGGQGTLTLSPTTLLLVNPGTRTDVTPTGLVNQGVIRATGANANLFLGAGSLNNGGLIEAVNGATIALSNWSSTGTIRVGTGSRIELGSFTTGATGTFENNGGIVALSGVVSNAGSTLSLSDSTGPWYTQGGRINGGTVNLSGSGQIRFDGPDMGSATRTLTLDGVTINGDMTLPNIPGSTNVRPSLRVRGDLGLNGTIRVLGSGNLITLENRNSNDAPDSINLTGGTIQLDPVFNGSTQFLASINSGPNMTLNIAPSAAIRGGNARFDIGTINNSGELSGNVEDANFAVNAGTLNNTGTIDASNFGRLNLNTQQFNNSGLIRVNYGSLTLGGTINLLPGTQFQRTGGTINLAGTLNNVGRTFVIDSSTGNINAAGGKVHGGTLEFRDGRAFVFRPRPDISNNGLTFESVSVVGDWDLRRGSVDVRGDLTVAGTVRVSDRGLGFGGTAAGQPAAQTFTGSLSLEGVENGSFLPGVFSVNGTPGFSVNIAATSVVRGGGASLGGGSSISTGLLANQGLISADRAGYRIDIRTSRFHNQGVAEARNGGVLSFFPNLSVPLELNNAGIIRAVAGGVVVFNGPLSLAAVGDVRNQGGTVRFSGFDLQGGTLALNDTTGTWTIANGLTNGTVTTSGSARLSDLGGTGFSNLTLNGNTLIVGGGSTFSNVTMNGETEITGYLGLRSDNTINGTMRLSGSGATLRVESTGTTPRTFNSGTFVFDNSSGGNPRVFTGTSDNSFTITLGAGVTIRGGNGNVRTNTRTFIVNNGLISADVAGQAITINSPRFTNNGIVEAINGGAIIYDPTLPPAGGSEPDPLLLSVGRLHVGPGSTLDLLGPLGLADSSVLMFTLSGAGSTMSSGRLRSDYDLGLDGELRVRFAPDFVPAVGARFSLLHAPGFSGEFRTVSLPLLLDDWGWDTSRLADSGELRIVPSPGGAALLVAASAALAGRRRRRGTMQGTLASLAIGLGVCVGLMSPSATQAQCVGFEPMNFSGGNGANGAVRVLRILDDGNGPALFAAGQFTSIGGIVATGVAKWNGTNWTALGSLSLGVLDLAMYDAGDGPSLFAVGSFTVNSPNGIISNVARWNGEAWAPVGLGASSGLNSTGTRATVFNDGTGPKLYVGGHFTSAGGVSAVRLASWNGVTWAPVATSSYDRSDVLVSCYDPLRARTIVTRAAGSGESFTNTLAWNGSAWQNLITGGPPVRGNAAMAFDGFRDRAVLFGGRRGGQETTNDTWLFDGTAWALAMPANRPPSRFQHSMVYDSARQRIVLFGGLADPFNAASVLGDTWEWDGTTWTQIAAVGPAPRWLAAMAYDSARQRTVLFGGFRFSGGGVPTSDTWEFDGASWVQSLAAFPTPVGQPTMTYDATRSRCVMHTGHTNGSPSNQSTWTYDGTAWAQAAVLGPTEREHPGPMTYDVVRGVAVQTGFLGETWHWNGTAWSLASSPFSGAATDMLVHDDGSGPALFVAGGAPTGIIGGQVSRYSAAGWSDVGSVLGTVNALGVNPRPAGARLVATGQISRASNNQDAYYTIEWNGGVWAPLGTIRPQGRALAVFDDGSGPALFAAASGSLEKLVGNNWVIMPVGGIGTMAALGSGSSARLVLGGDFSCPTSGYPASNLINFGAPCSPPTITAQPVDQQAAFGQAINLVVTALGTAPITFQWRKGGQPIAGGVLSNCDTTSSLRIDGWSLNTAGSYDCVVSNPHGQAVSNTAQVSIPFGPGVGPVAVSRILYPPEPAPDLPPGNNYTFFIGPIVSNTGDVAFIGYLNGTLNRNDGEQVLGMWREGTTNVIVRSGAPAPGVVPGITFAHYNSGISLFNTFGIASNGNMYHLGDLAGPNIGSFNRAGLWHWFGPAGSLVARAGRPAAGVDAELSFSSLRDARICDTGLIGFAGALDDGFSSGLWTWTSTGGQRLLARSGDIAPGGDLRYEGFVAAPILSTNGRVAYGSNLTSLDGALRVGSGVWAGTPSSPQLIARSDMPAPGLPPGATLGSVSVSDNCASASGDVFVLSGIVDGSGQSRKAVYRWSSFSGQLSLVVGRGQPAPGQPPGHSMFTAIPVSSNAPGDLLFVGSAQTPQGISDQGLWFAGAGGGQVSLITTFRGVSHPTLPPGWAFESLVSAGMSDNREVVFAADVRRTGDTTYTAVFGWTPTLGLFPIAFPSNQIEVAPGVFRTLSIARLSAVQGGVSGPIVTSSITGSGLVVFEATFTDGSRGIFSGQFGGFALRFFPCRADFNADGDVNADDLADFINCFFESPPCPAAEFNADGDVNADDLADYINVFFGPPC